MDPDPPLFDSSTAGAAPPSGVLFPSLYPQDVPPSLFSAAASTSTAAFTLRAGSTASSPRSRAISASPVGSPRRRARSATPEVESGAALVADVQMTRSRLLITKTSTLYPPPSSTVPFQSCVIGLRAVFHPLSQSRLKDADISIRFLSPMGEPDATPVIKALYPARLVGEDTADVKKTTSVAAGLSLGYDPFAQLNVSSSQAMEVSWMAHSSVIGSGVETSVAMFSLVENQASHVGLEPTMDFALLLYLPSSTTRSFEAEMTVEATVANPGIRDAARHLIGSPRIYRLIFDGETELGTLNFS